MLEWNILLFTEGLYTPVYIIWVFKFHLNI